MHRDRLVTLFLTATAVLAGLAVLAGVALALGAPSGKAPAAKTRPSISGLPQVGKVLHAHPGKWSRGSRFAYRWQRCNARGQRCKVIQTRRHRPYAKASYAITRADLGHRMRLMVIATNRRGSRTAWSRMTARIAKAGSSTTFRPISPLGGSPAPGSAGGTGGSGTGGTGTGGGGGVGILNIATGQSVGFWVAADGSMSESQIPWNAVTQVDMFALQTTNGSGLDSSSQGVPGNPASWVATVHQQGRLALITIGGIADQNWQNACNNTNRSAFVTNLVNYMKTNGFDGIDLDIEDNNWASQNAPVAAWDTCVQAIATAAHATTTAAGNRPIVSEDVTTPWMGAYLTNDASYVDQFNLMTYGETVSQVNSDVATTAADGIPKSKMIVGIDLVDNGEPSGGCAQYAAYAQQQGLPGVLVWDIQSDRHSGSFPCFTQLAPFVASTP